MSSGPDGRVGRAARAPWAVAAARPAAPTAATVANGREALDHLKASNPRPCVILLDLMMPVMDGWQFRKEQKQDPEIAGIPLVVITATGNRPVLIDAAELVMKPLDLNRLFEAIGRYCA